MTVVALTYSSLGILAFRNFLTGRRDEVGCMLFTPIDRAEAHGRLLRLSDSHRR